MTGMIIVIASRKGGVSKSTLARLVAREYAADNWNGKIADLDVSQGTNFNWQARRLQDEVEPVIAVERFGGVEPALKQAYRWHTDLREHQDWWVDRLMECQSQSLPTSRLIVTNRSR